MSERAIAEDVAVLDRALSRAHEARRKKEVVSLTKAESEAILDAADRCAKLESVCRKFVDDNHIECAETVYQTDWVSENALPFIEAVCEVVGYAKDPDDDEPTP